MMPQPGLDAANKNPLSFSGSSAASLHAKTFIVDQLNVFIGSMNLDPRSVHINTEIGLLVDSPELAKQLQSHLEANLSRTCFKVVLEASKQDGHKDLAWIEQRDGETIRYDKEPQTTFWQRFGVGLVSLFPVDSQL